MSFIPVGGYWSGVADAALEARRLAVICTAGDDDAGAAALTRLAARLDEERQRADVNALVDQRLPGDDDGLA